MLNLFSDVLIKLHGSETCQGCIFVKYVFQNYCAITLAHGQFYNCENANLKHKINSENQSTNLHNLS